MVVAENDTTSAAYGAGDESWCLPRYDDPGFEAELFRLVDALKPLAYISLNDYELVKLGEGIGQSLQERGVLVPGVSQEWMRIAADKLLMSKRLVSLGIHTPVTYLGSDSDGLADLAQASERMIVKHRFGSASSGLHVSSGADLKDAIRSSAETAMYLEGGEPLDAVIAQPLLPGKEFGVDVVSSLVSPGEFRGVLVREKIRMRAGETDKAISTTPDAFQEVGARIAVDTELRGLLDMDVMVDIHGSPNVIDINPRFGGGYPFVHLAGADVPLMYLAEALGLETNKSVLEYVPGITSAKFEGIRLTSAGKDMA
ncbi:ATP-grasp domain-containing protein [Cellulosimicrobium funkei]|nr:ATP-grasp domain-containing protein [Cellulosimicrobium funkei]